MKLTKVGRKEKIKKPVGPRGLFYPTIILSSIILKMVDMPTPKPCIFLYMMTRQVEWNGREGSSASCQVKPLTIISKMDDIHTLKQYIFLSMMTIQVDRLFLGPQIEVILICHIALTLIKWLDTPSQNHILSKQVEWNILLDPGGHPHPVLPLTCKNYYIG